MGDVADIKIAYLEKWRFEYHDDKWTQWIARDKYGNGIVSANTKKKCEADCRELGYVPRRKEEE